MAVNWPTHRARRTIRLQRLRWEAKARKRDRENLVRTKAPRAPKPVKVSAPISDWAWDQAAGRR